MWSSPTQSKKRRQPWPCGLTCDVPTQDGRRAQTPGRPAPAACHDCTPGCHEHAHRGRGADPLGRRPPPVIDQLLVTNIMAARRCGMLPAHYAGCLHTDAARCTLGSSSAAAHAPPAGHVTMCTWHAGTTRANLAIAALICPRHHLRPHHQPPAAHQPGNLRSLVSIHSPAALAATCSCAQVPPGARQWQRRWRRW